MTAREDMTTATAAPGPRGRRPRAGGGAAVTNLAGTGTLVRLILRRDRLWLLLWVVLVAGVVAGGAGTAGDTYPTAQARQERFDQLQNIPMFMLFQSRAYDSSIAALAVQQAFGGATIFAALGAVVFVVRHTRGEEQAGRRELLGATVVGRHAPLTAAFGVVSAAGAVLAVLCAAGLAGSGLPAAGSLAFGLVVGAAVGVAAAMAAVAAQVTTSARAAGTAAFVGFYGSHLVRGISDMGGERLAWLGWLVPNGWLERVRPFAGEQWWVFGLVAVFVAVLLAVAVRLSSRRDLAAGLLPPRLGPATAAPGLRSPLGLAWRLHRSMLLVWVGAVGVLGLALGAVGADAMREYAQGEWLREYAAVIGAANPGDAFFIYVVFVMVFPITLYAVMALLRLRAEEAGGTAEAVLATAVDRSRWATSHLAVAAGAPVVLLVVMGTGLGLGAGAAGGDLGGELAGMLAFTVSLTPAVWVIVGITMAAFGLRGPASAVVGWAALAVGVAAEIVVKMGALPEWAFLAVSPFAHVNPYYEPTAVTYLLLTFLAAALVGVGLAGLRRRDLVG